MEREVFQLKPILDKIGPIKDASSLLHCLGVKHVTPSGYRSMRWIIVTYPRYASNCEMGEL
jgi:hypothetical protein